MKTNAVYISTMEPRSGKSLVTLGMMRMLLGKTAKVGYFKPIIQDFKNGEKDNHIETILSHFDLDIKFEEAYACTKSDVIEKKYQGQESEIITKIIEKYKAIENRFDFMLVEGTDFSGEGTSSELDMNTFVAKNLGIPVIIVESGKGKTMDDFVDNLLLTYDSFSDKDVKVLSVVANKVQKKNIEMVKNGLSKKLPQDVIINVIPIIKSLINPTIHEILKKLNAKVIFGKEHLSNQTNSFVVGAMSLRHYLPRLKENCLVITPGDRGDIIMGSLQAHISSNYPKISGIILTGGILPEDSILQLITGLSHIIPILSVKEGTFDVTSKIGKVESKIYSENTTKILSSIRNFEKYVDVDKLADKLITFETKGMTPSMFQYNLLKKAQVDKKHIILPEGEDERILRAAARLVSAGIVDITLLGSETRIRRIVTRKGIPLKYKKINIVNPIESPYFDEYVQTFYELRKHKNVNMAIAQDKMSNVSYFGTMMVYKGHADGMVSGATHTTQHTILPALQFVKTKPGVSVVSSIFFMCLPDRVSIFGDCAINPNPNAEELAEIAISSADSSAAFGIEPKVAMLSYSSGVSGKGEDVEKVREATEIVKRLRPDIKIEGPIQYDAAVNERIGKTKLPDSDVAGEASVLIFPDLNTGNNTYKAVERETGALAIGPMLQGLNKPINDLSRGCDSNDVFNTVIITAIQAQTK